MLNVMVFRWGAITYVIFCLCSLPVPTLEGPSITIQRVNRLQMGAYLCIASNGVPPSVSKRILLIVHCEKLKAHCMHSIDLSLNELFPVSPMIEVQNQLVGAFEGQCVTLECHSEAHPKSINYWTRDKGNIVPKGELLIRMNSTVFWLCNTISYRWKVRTSTSRNGL